MLQIDIDDLPEIDPVVLVEKTETGWLGITQMGEIFDVSAPGVPDQNGIIVTRNGRPVARRPMPAQVARSGTVRQYKQLAESVVALYQACRPSEALAAADAALAISDTARVRFNRSLVLLELGCWDEAWKDFDTRFEFYRPALLVEAQARGIPQWNGEAIWGKRLLLVHDAGYGDTIQQLRYVRTLGAMGADVCLLVPPALTRFASRIAPLDDRGPYDFYCPMLSLLRVMRQRPDNVPTATPWYPVEPGGVMHWLTCLGNVSARKIGIAWKIGQINDGDFPREAALEMFVDRLATRGRLFSVQAQDGQAAERLGITAFPFRDFADCAAFVSLMDEIVTIDTAAVHVAGSIGHPNVTVLLSHWASWRFRNSPFYPEMKLCRQQAPGDWASAFEQV